MSGAIVRPAACTDLKAVAEIFEHYVRHTSITFERVPPTVADWERRLGRRGLPFLVAALDGEVLGYAHAVPWRPQPSYRYTVEDSIYLAPDRTGAGLGGELLGALVDECGRVGLRQMVAVISDAAGEVSVALHRRFGFVRVGRLDGVGFKHGRSIGTVLMQRDLTAG